MKRSVILGAATMFMVAALGSVTLFAQPEANNGPGYNSTTTTTVSGATGTIIQLNYGSDGTVSGFLIGTDVLLAFPTPVTGGIATLGAVGSTVTYSGTAVTSSSGFESVRVSSFKDGTATYTAPTSAPTPAAYPSTAGTVKQLNYNAQGDIDGFVFLPSVTGATEILVLTAPQASATLKPLLTVGATISVTGDSETGSPTSCTASGALAVVDATSLTIGTQTIVIAGGGSGVGHPGPVGPGGPRH
jgi:hypothetical protein